MGLRRLRARVRDERGGGITGGGGRRGRAAREPALAHEGLQQRGFARAAEAQEYAAQGAVRTRRLEAGVSKQINCVWKEECHDEGYYAFSNSVLRTQHYNKNEKKCQ